MWNLLGGNKTPYQYPTKTVERQYTPNDVKIRFVKPVLSIIIEDDLTNDTKLHEELRR